MFTPYFNPSLTLLGVTTVRYVIVRGFSLIWPTISFALGSVNEVRHPPLGEHEDSKDASQHPTPSLFASWCSRRNCQVINDSSRQRGQPETISRRYWQDQVVLWDGGWAEVYVLVRSWNWTWTDSRLPKFSGNANTVTWVPFIFFGYV